MKERKRRSAGAFPGFDALCAAAFVLVTLSVFCSGAPAGAGQLSSETYDNGGAAVFDGYVRMPEAYMSGGSTERTLLEYYSRRQYPGSPPFIPHAVEEEFGKEVQCLSCHGGGGWVQEYMRHAPVTPHPDQTYCRQCHMRLIESDLFRETEWVSVPPPRLGRSALPGSPPPIPHSLQMRANCLACHAGPGAVTDIRAEHAARGNCRQCHVPESGAPPFRKGEP